MTTTPADVSLRRPCGRSHPLGPRARQECGDQPARDAFRARFVRQVDPEGKLDPVELEKA